MHVAEEGVDSIESMALCYVVDVREEREVHGNSSIKECEWGGPGGKAGVWGWREWWWGRRSIVVDLDVCNVVPASIVALAWWKVAIHVREQQK